MNNLTNRVHHGRARLLAGVGVAALSLTVFASPAFAQDDETTAAETETASQAPPSGTIVVTGSRIRRDEYSTIEPITVVTAEEITQAGFTSATEALQSTGVTAGAGQINNYFGGFVTDGGTGANTLGLRGLGPSRTLILLNGRRLAPGGTRGSVLAADLNVLPTAIVDRIEVLKAGASSIYGSDAVAGVVNIITDQQLKGLQIEAQATVPEVGDGSAYRLAASFGFQADRLSVIGSVEYQKRYGLSRNDQPWFRCPIGGYLNGAGTEFGSGDGVGFDGSPCFTLDNGGVTINTLGVPSRAAPSRLTGVVGNFTRLVPDSSNVAGPTPGYTGVTFYSRDTLPPDQEKEYLITPAEIYTGYLSTTYDLDSLGNAQVYGEALVTRRKSEYFLHRQLILDYPKGSPLLPDQFRNPAGRFSGPVNTSNGLDVAARAFIDGGLTDGSQTVDYVRLGGGIRGDFFLPDWRYDFYAGKAWNDGEYHLESFLIDRMANSFDVIDNGDGTFSCSVSDPNCVAAPFLTPEIIGGQVPQNYLDYILVDTVGHTKFRETTFAFNIDGPFMTLPGGDAQVALGVEYRKQRIADRPDANSLNGNLYGLTASTPTIGSDSVLEAYGEVYLPLISNVPFANMLSITGSARYTDYDSYGSDTTYKVAAEWEPVAGLGFRASYGTSYRAPALAEQFLGSTSGFISQGNDPCDSDNFPANPANYSPDQVTIATNCASQGIDVATFIQNSSVTVFRRGGADTGLAAETSKNWSVGVIAQPNLPDAIGDLSLSLDYFDIQVNNGVQDLSGATILNRCYTDPTFNPNDGFCSFVTRDANDRLSVVSSFVNLSQDNVEGWEFNGRYARDIGKGRFVLNANVVMYTEQSSKIFPEEFLFDWNGFITSPKWVGTFDASYTIGKVRFRYGLDWTGGDNGKTYEAIGFDSETGEVDQDFADLVAEFYDFTTPDYFLHHASVQFDVDNFEMTIGVRNMFDKQPPRVTTPDFGYFNIAAGNAPLYSGYDYRGRTFFVNATMGF